MSMSNPVHAQTTIANPSFETGDLSGWKIVSGNAFNEKDVTEETSFWDKQTFDQKNFWHIWGGRGDDTKVGVMQSETFTLGGDGQIDFLTGGDSDPDHLSISLVRESDGVELMKETGTGTDTYSKKSWDASAHVGAVVRMKVVDSMTNGHINIDDVNVPATPSLHDHVEPSIYNHDFEYTALTPYEIRGWEIVSGDAFGPESLVHEEEWSEGDEFSHEGRYHLWSFNDGGDDQVGELHSEPFTIDQNGGIDFLIGGGNDEENLYVALVRTSDGKELRKETGRDTEKYRRVYWDVSEYIGEEVVIKIVDHAKGAFGHINVDDFRTNSSPFADGLMAHWSLDEGTGQDTVEQVTGETNLIDYHLSKGVFQEAQDPLWKDGISNGSLLFDGYSTWIKQSPTKLPAPKEAITVEAWVAPRNFEHGDEGRLSAIVNQHNREKKEGFILGNFRHGTWGLQFGTGEEWHEVMSDTLLPLNEWSYVVATYDSTTGEAVLYQNGEKVTSRKFDAGAAIKPSVRDLLIGKNNDGMWLYGFDLNMFSGLMDEVKIYNQALSAGNVKDSYESYVSALNGNLPTADIKTDRSLLADDQHRPQFHMSPPNHWGNEPGGPIYFNGQYHVFYQSNPRGPYWNHIRWGHLVSDDMVHWRDVDDAVIPGRYDVDPEGAWAGGAVVDDNGVPVIFYTAGDDRDQPNQRINLARSTFLQDGDNDLNRWEKNSEVILDQEEGQGIMGEFRDPYVFKDGDTWYMLVTSGKEGTDGKAVGGTALVYSTKDESFEDWTFEGDLFVGDYGTYPETGRVWELPILLPLGDSGKHIFLINPAKMEREEYQSRYTYYWIGTWNPDTAKFTPDNETPQLLDVGDHFTGPAGMVTPDGRTVIHSITQGRRPANDDYDAGYAHNYGLPTEVFYRDDGKLGIKPIQELNELRGEELINLTSDTSMEEANQLLSNIEGDMLEIQLELDNGSANEAGISLRRSPNGEEETIVYFKESSKEFWVNRTKSSLDPDVEKWYQGGEVDTDSETINLHVYVDRSEINAYLNEQKGLTTRAYPTRDDAKGVQLWANEQSESVTVKSLQVWEMNSAYEKVNATGVALNPDSLELIAGDTERLTPEVKPAQATNKEVIWTSSNPSVATVVNGKVTAHSDGATTIKAETRDGGHTATSAITVVEEPSHDELVNHDFEAGNLTGWTVMEGDAFSDLDVTSADNWGWGGPFNQNGAFHLYSVHNGNDAATGTIRSQKFTLGGNGQIDFLVSGGNDIYNLYVALVRSSDGKEVMKVSGGNQEGYTRVKWDASDYIGEQVYLKVVDRSKGSWGHISIDDVNAPVKPPNNVTIANPNFETGDLSGWKVTGEAFSDQDITQDEEWEWDCCFNHQDAYHLWNFKDGGDADIGEIQSQPFTLYGSGWIDFLIGGGKDNDHLYVSLVREADGKELLKSTGTESEKYKRVYWDASSYIGEDVFIKVVDKATGGWGHINVDDFHVFNSEEDILKSERYEKYRSQFHYTPEKNWMNDPNGLVYHNGEYHVFYQYNPTGISWGPMNWGHAVSTDLVNWERLPTALEEDENGFIWSGSVVVDEDNTAGFGKDAMVAMFTHEKGGNQSQSLAYSNDNGRSWQKYAGNPVLTNLDQFSVFRDPKVFWHEASNQWVMLLAVEDQFQKQFVRIYHSKNMKDWTFASDFGENQGSHEGVWEVPDLFPLPVDGDPQNTKWVMQVSLSKGAPAGGSGVQYFIGDFDGTNFRNDNLASTVLYADYGADYYAPLTFNHVPDGRRIAMGWMNNWEYGQAIPTSIWRSKLTVPKELSLKSISDLGVRLVQNPVSELQSLRGEESYWTNEIVVPGENLLSDMKGDTLEIVAEFQTEQSTAKEFGFNVRVGRDEFTEVSYNITNATLSLDRSKSGDTSFSQSFAAKHEAIMMPSEGVVTLHLLVDRSSIEVFGNDGQVVFSDQIFPHLTSNQIELYAIDGEISMKSLAIYQLDKATISNGN
ncbi:GH32 C-terminal domain-containing protein [Guptibacillus hwajinpoensis]|uniref:GH32 C-terminal domain-containing protein n=1 Tax=Guptibacillus hwajinpoensis TaxID=208199 RepID=UPI001CD37202|nr:GH32 C-terminal domain-containing protein [Pseudalkalibacillus hwajinpoensis]MCA0991950.1 GH32 C-terminal domain-containing protein [Pseudalkalibacillus hwajinpoensis]